VEKARITVRRVAGATVVELAGEHDLSTHGEVSAALEGVDPETPCVVDLSSAAFIDSSILAALIQAALRDGPSPQTVVVAAPGSAPARLFELTQATTVVQVCPSLDDALDSVMIRE
jgi:anti-sigma B factor antagonist